MNSIVLERQANSNCSKSSLLKVTEFRNTSLDTFDTAIEIDGSKFQMDSSVELQDKYNNFKDFGNEFSINKLTIFSTSLFIPYILIPFKSGSLYLESN